MADTPIPQRPRAGSPTLVQVAAHADVSPMTVSRVLSGGGKVSSSTRERVLAAVDALGYRRNELARSLRPGQRSGLIGVVITNIANPYYAEFVLGVEEVALEGGRRILLGITSEDEQREAAVIDDFVGRQIEGMIAVPVGKRGQWDSARLGDLPLVFASRAVRGVVADAVLVDDITGAREVTAALIEAGHSRIAFLGNSASVFTGRRRHLGWTQAMATAGISVDESLVFRGQQDSASAEDVAGRLLDLPDPPTAIFAANNRNGIGVLQAMSSRFGRARRRHGRAAPAIAVFDSFDLAELVPWDLLLVRHDPHALGRRAAELLLRRLDGAEAGEKAVTLTMPAEVVRLS